LRYWIKNIQDNAPENVDRVIVGNKSDLVEKRIISTERGKEFADSQKLHFYETSAKEGTSVDDAFMDLARQVKQRVSDTDTTKATNTGVSDGTTVIPTQPAPTQQKGCC
jgi:GTPase SAR1 family protein